MLDQQTIENLSTKLQTTTTNIIREYFQHLFLSHFYNQKNSENFLFKGGTALRVIYNSPRFSEDLDFSGITNGPVYEDVLESTLLKLTQEGIELELKESKQTSEGWFSIIDFTAYKQTFQIKNEISYRTPNPTKENILISSEFLPTYHLTSLHRKELVKEKIEALLSRGKSRDFFDLYFILRDRRLRHSYTIPNSTRKQIIALIESTDPNPITRELSDLLPTSYREVSKNLPHRLQNELA